MNLSDCGRRVHRAVLRVFAGVAESYTGTACTSMGRFVGEGCNWQQGWTARRHVKLFYRGSKHSGG